MEIREILATLTIIGMGLLPLVTVNVLLNSHRNIKCEKQTETFKRKRAQFFKFA